MATKKALIEIKQHLDASVGKRIKLRANKGRKKIVERIGILEQTYPNVFVIKLDGKPEMVRRISFSYTDVLTETVELVIYRDQEEMEDIV